MNQSLWPRDFRALMSQVGSCVHLCGAKSAPPRFHGIAPSLWAALFPESREENGYQGTATRKRKRMGRPRHVLSGSTGWFLSTAPPFPSSTQVNKHSARDRKWTPVLINHFLSEKSPFPPKTYCGEGGYIA